MLKVGERSPIQSSKGHLIHFCQIVLKFVGTSSNDKYILCLFGFWGEEVVDAWWDLITLRGKTQIMCNSFPKTLYNTYWFDLICHEQKPFPTHWKYIVQVLLYVIWVLGFRNNNNDLFVVYWLLVFVIEIPLYFLCPELQSLFWIMHPTT